MNDAVGVADDDDVVANHVVVGDDGINDDYNVVDDDVVHDGKQVDEGVF